MKLLLLLIAIMASETILGQTGRLSPHDTVSSDKATVTYGRPYKKGRDIFGGLEKFGNVWRVGADEATTITFKSDVRFGGEEIKAGTYTLFAIPTEKEWGIIVNSQLGQWGAFEYQKYINKNVARFTIPVKKLDNVIEQLTIRFTPGNMIIEWDKTQIVISIE